MDAPTDDPTNDPSADPIAIPITKHKDPTGIPTANPPMEETLLVQLLSNHARLPIRSTPESAGLDLFSAATVTITSNTQQLIPTDISICPPPGTYCQILPRSGLVLKHCVTTRAGTIDRDYCGNVQVILHNTPPHHTRHHTKIPTHQRTLYQLMHPPILPSRHPQSHKRRTQQTI
jgi:deoxyuridine 5'-triphosphate nucleotidohydrolase